MRQSLFMALGFALSLGGCVHYKVHRFPDRPAVWVDADENHVEERVEDYWSGLSWDGADQTIFLPVQRALGVTRPGMAANVNSWDEVPDSSWFRNRIGMRAMSDEELAQGSCPDELLDPSRPWTVTAAKPNGANPGFIIKGPEGRGWLLKFDGLKQPDRATTADVLGSRLYHAAGYFSPCNIIVFFEPDVLQMGEGAETKDHLGNDRPMNREDVDTVLAAAGKHNDGRLRASASLFLPGRPVGPWTYQGTRKDDPNDVINHEDRRELRGAKLMAAWTNHFDAREQNTLAIWAKEDGRTFVRHYYLDFGDTLGSIWWWTPMSMSHRFGYSYYLDMGDVGMDWLTLGALKRPWNQLEISDRAPVGFFAAEPFAPERYKTGYPNPAFLRMLPEDGSWMARILARMDGPALRVMLEQGEMQNKAHEEEVFRILSSRRDRILAYYLRIRSPLADFRMEDNQLCFADLLLQTGMVGESDYDVRAYVAPFSEPVLNAAIEGVEDGMGCVSLADVQPDSRDPYLIVDLIARPRGEDDLPPARVHLMGGAKPLRIVGIERPADGVAPKR